MSILPDFSRQYQPPKIPTHWSADERRFAQGVTDVLDDIYLRYGRLSKKDLSPALSKEILDASGNIVQLQLDTSGLTTRMLSAEGDISTLEQTATSFGTRITNAEGDISTLEQTANSLISRVSGVEGVNSTQQTEINQNKLDITLKASETTVTALAGRVTTAESSISIQAGQIALKAEKTVTDGLNTRLTSAEEKITPNAITATVRSHANYQSDLSAKNRTFVGGTPTGMIAGDLWIDSANGNLLKRYDGSAWAAVQDGAISVAQQQADKIQWLVASGTSAANMTLTSQLYSLMAENIDLSANESINLTVSNIRIGGRNLIVLSNLSSMTQYLNNSGVLVGNSNYAITGFIPAMPNTEYIMSGYSSLGTQPATCFYDSNKVFISGFSSYARRQFTTPANTSFIKVSVLKVDLDTIKLEVGNKATDWTPAPEDPASGVKTSTVTIDTNGVAIVTGGVFTVSSGNFGIDASGNVTMKGQVEATSGKIGGFTLSNGALTSNTGFFIDPTLSLPQMSIKYLNMGSMSNGAYLTCTYTAGYSAFDIQNPYGFVSIRGGRSNQWGGSLTLSRDVNGLKLAQISDKLQVSDTVYIENNCSALSFTDRTPAYFGDALAELRWVSGSRSKGIDHNSIPKFAQKKVLATRLLADGTKENYEEEGRDLGAMVSVLTRAVQQIVDITDRQQKQIDQLIGGRTA